MQAAGQRSRTTLAVVEQTMKARFFGLTSYELRVTTDETGRR